MNPKLPYYMAYPMPLAFDDEWLERRDYEYMKSMYPDAAKRILPYVEEECDRNEYPCSMMYDEYPDRLQLRMMANRIYQNMMEDEQHPSQRLLDRPSQRPPDRPSQRPPQRPSQRPPQRPPQRPDQLRDLIELLLFEELQRRRNQHRRLGQRIVTVPR